MDSGRVGKPLRKFITTICTPPTPPWYQAQGAHSCLQPKIQRRGVSTFCLNISREKILDWSSGLVFLSILNCLSWEVSGCITNSIRSPCEPIIHHSSYKNRSHILKEQIYLLKAGFTSSSKTSVCKSYNLSNFFLLDQLVTYGESLNFPWPQIWHYISFVFLCVFWNSVLQRRTNLQSTIRIFCHSCFVCNSSHIPFWLVLFVISGIF